MGLKQTALSSTSLLFFQSVISGTNNNNNNKEYPYGVFCTFACSHDLSCSEHLMANPNTVMSAELVLRVNKLEGHRKGKSEWESSKPIPIISYIFYLISRSQIVHLQPKSSFPLLWWKQKCRQLWFHSSKFLGTFIFFPTFCTMKTSYWWTQKSMFECNKIIAKILSYLVFSMPLGFLRIKFKKAILLSEI